MTKFWKTYQILMVFLLLWFVMPIASVQAQQEESYMMPVTTVFPFENGGNQGLASIPDPPAVNQVDVANHQFDIVDGEALAGDYGYFHWTATSTATYMAEKRTMYGLQEDENYIRLFTDGENNQFFANQENGHGNIMDVNIYGNANDAHYLQYGSDNFIYDQIGEMGSPVNGVYREINQYGSGLGIHNQGIPDLDMIINQWGNDMKLLITHSP